ncbi:MAG: alpha/beta hydrolase [Planctomycetaceae bacterium]|nr:alpha/beta hydrolase [Planctomycetaceae bacterium]
MPFCRFIFLFFVFFGIASTIYGEQDIWLIDTHSVSWNRASENDFGRIEYRRFRNHCWEDSNAAAFFDSQNPLVPLILFAPGYTSTTANTIEVGLGITQLLTQEKPHRMVFWNWPSQRISHGLRQDIRAKIPVAAANGQYMAQFLQLLKPDSQVCLLGFSFGNRIIGDAVVHLENDQPQHLRIRMVMASPATDQHDFLEGAKYAPIPERVEKILVLYNPNDFRLSFYPFLYDPAIPIDALGRYGPSASVRQKYQDKIEAVNVDSYIGIRHKTLIVLNTPAFRQRINTYLFFEP